MVSKEVLSEKLGRFYCEARPKPGEISATPNEYHKNTLKNIRAGINRYLGDINRNIDIVNEKEFRRANKLLDGLLKDRMASGISKPTQHKEIVEEGDLTRIMNYFNGADTSVFILRQCVWYNIAVHFVTRGLEFHHQLKINSFEFKSDENGVEYACLTHECRQKNFQGGLSNNEAISDKRMYATGEKNCPVKLLKTFIDKTDPNATSLFNGCVKDAIKNPIQHQIWYHTRALGKSSFNHFMPDISKYAKCSKRYTAHCLRATAIQKMSDEGFQCRQIMMMSGHRNEASIRSYNRNCTSTQKRSLSNALSTLTGNVHTPSSSTSIENTVHRNMFAHSHNDSNFVVASPCNQPSPSPSIPNGAIQATATSGNLATVPSQSMNPMNLMSSSSFQTMAGFLSNSYFNNCSFHFEK